MTSCVQKTGEGGDLEDQEERGERNNRNGVDLGDEEDQTGEEDEDEEDGGRRRSIRGGIVTISEFGRLQFHKHFSFFVSV